MDDDKPKYTIGARVQAADGHFHGAVTYVSKGRLPGNWFYDVKVDAPFPLYSNGTVIALLENELIPEATV